MSEESLNDKFAPKLKVSQELLRQMIDNAPISDEMREKISTQLPMIADSLDEATRRIYDPQKIWFESIQYADYVDQLSEHLRDSVIDGHDDGCKMEIAVGLHTMSCIWKAMAENAMTMLDDLKIKAEMFDFDEIIIGIEDKDAQ
jgi:hypothetical protein